MSLQTMPIFCRSELMIAYRAVCGIMTSEVYAAVRENFRQAEEYGWFLPGTTGDHSTLVFERANHKHAAVLFLIGLIQNEPYVLITKRSNNVRTHKGETCLPGGMCERSDGGPVETALREAHEEVHLDPEKVEVLTVMPPFPSGWNELIVVNPVVCLLRCSPSELKLVPNKEVECVFWVPLHTFLRGKVNQKLLWRGKWVSPVGYIYRDPKCGRDHFIWGLTGLICAASTAIALNTSPYYPHTAACIADAHEGRVVLQQLAITSQLREEWAVLTTKTESQRRNPLAKL